MDRIVFDRHTFQHNGVAIKFPPEVVRLLELETKQVMEIRVDGDSIILKKKVRNLVGKPDVPQDTRDTNSQEVTLNGKHTSIE